MSQITNSNESLIEQYPSSIRDFSSQYGSDRTRSYAIGNIVCQRPEIYPLYGDSTHALVFRTYGPWWLNMPSSKEYKKYFSRTETHFTSRDYLDIQYDNFVDQPISLNIYETYNPGTLEVVYAGKEDDHREITWYPVWKYPEPFSILLKNNEEIFIENGHQQINDLFPNHVSTATSALHSLHLNTDNQQISKIHTNHSYPPAARLPRIVKIPLKNKIPFRTRHIRLEFDHCTSNYYIEIDTITLSSSLSQSHVSPPMISKTNEENKEITGEFDLTKLPFDILFLICSHLDLRSLVRFSSTCQYLRQQCLHSLQFLSLNLQPYWNRITNDSIENFFLNHCQQTRYLSLSWTKSIGYSPFSQLLDTCSNNLVQLNLACCQYLTAEYIETIATCSNLEILNLENCNSLTNKDFIPLQDLRRLRTLNVYRTRIDYRTLLPLINNNKEHFENLNIGSCSSLIDTIGIVKLLFGRCKNLRSIDLWRQYGLNQNGYLSIIGSPYNMEEEEVRFANLSEEEQEELSTVYFLTDMPCAVNSLQHLTCLSEIDMGWTDPAPGFVQNLVQQAGHSLIKIFLTACRRISNEDIYAISANCPKLRQLDILGSNVITESAIEAILQRCPSIEFMDLSFCSKISDATITRWISQYKNCFKRSYSPMDNGDIYSEYP